MKFTRLLIVAGFAISLPAWAIYAPIPEQQQGKALTVSLTAGVSHDSNIFGAPTGAIGSTIYSASPKVEFNASVTNQTFLSAFYQLTLDHFDNRPGDKTLDSHNAMVRVAHAFTQASTLDLSDTFSIQKNPESLLAGLPINSDQSFQRNEADGRFSTSLTGKAGLTLKARSVLYRYDNARLGANLDRAENLFGVSGDYAVLPEMKAVGEYRHQIIAYRQAGENKDKSSDFGLVGADYNVSKKLTATGRFGFEDRQRDAERSETVPYAEISAKYDYVTGSFLSAGYIYTLEETSNVALYTDTLVNRFFANVQHAITAKIAASGSIDYEPSQLQGRRGLPNVDETTTRLGVALSYLPTKNWIISASYDYDDVSSDDVTREFNRNRVGLTATYTF